MKVQLFIPCFIDQLFPQTALNTIKILEKAGCSVLYNTSQTCCGQPAYNAGFWDDSRVVAEKFIKDFDSPEYIVAPGGSCVGFVRNHYEKLFAGNDLAKSKLLTGIYELTAFLTEVLSMDDLGAVFNGVATYHDACGALRECGIKTAPRKMLSKVKGLQMVETDDCEVCCGFGGTFAVKFEAISTGMAEQKVHHAIEKGVQYIISTDSSCLLHLDGYIKKHGLAIKTVHIADVLASGW
ncbi:(Fe-S)-binding protein [Agriterribacter sp.]|uniref:(Fe-S)-binding protein n=1 Tax=Agriterribacter sp. TaxID=2821509 RepID=UPI002CE520C9|nr:(Fe-S)-binding protein [Agriterribacter sp.]HTN06192.1 (Fe-S)-binding protein [Agriterribacter sp.]